MLHKLARLFILSFKCIKNGNKYKWNVNKVNQFWTPQKNHNSLKILKINKNKNKNL
jgi:hypothetical protein